MNLGLVRTLLAASLAAAVLVSAPASLHAQAATGTPAKATSTPLSADYKGTIGLGLIGAELGFVIPALAEMDATWAYIVFPIVGAAGGAAAGYFGLERGNQPELAVASLTLGMALVIPAMVITLSSTAYDPEEEAGDTGQARGKSRLLAKAPRKLHPRAQDNGPGMLRLSEQGLIVAAPGISILPSTQGRDLRIAEVRMSLFSGRF